MAQQSGDLSLFLRLKATAKEWVEQVNAAGNSLRDLGPAGRRGGAEAAEGVEQISDEVNQADSKITLLARSLKGLGAALAARFFIDANAQAEQLAKGFEVLSGNAEDAADELDFARSAAARLGLPLRETADAYLQLAAAAKDTVLEGQPARGIFLAVANALARLGKDAHDVQGALLAVQQIISKGTVSAEELRGQLGERLPGAFQAAARALGVTTAELNKLLEQGALAAEDLLPALATELNRTFDSPDGIDSFTASMNRFWGALKDGLAQIGETTGILRGLGVVAEGAGITIGGIAVGFVSLAERAKAAGIAVAEFFKVMTGDRKFIEFKRNVEEAFSDANQAIEDAADRAFGKWEKGAADAGQSAHGAAGAVSAIGAAADGAGDQLEQLARRGAGSASSLESDYEKAAKAVEREHERARKKAEQELRQRADALRDFVEETEDLVGQFDSLRDRMSGVDTAASGFDLLDTFRKAVGAVNTGDGEEAIAQIRRAKDLLDSLADAEELGSAELEVWSQRFKELALEAQGLREKSLLDPDKTRSVIDQIESDLERIKTVGVDLDTSAWEQKLAALQAQASANPIVIPVVYEVQGGGGNGNVQLQPGQYVSGGNDGLAEGRDYVQIKHVDEISRASRAAGSKVP